jgi:hypothetical protein
LWIAGPMEWWAGKPSSAQTLKLASILDMDDSRKASSPGYLF